MADLRIRFTRIDNQTHRFEAVRPDGSVEMRVLETRSFLLHDLVHFAVESEAKLRNSFYGQLARGAGYEDLTTGGESAGTEMVVGALQGALKGEVDAHAFVARLKEMCATLARDPPEWLTPDMIARALERLRQVQGQWRATKFGETLELAFDL
jgi:hypothetical protein